MAESLVEHIYEFSLVQPTKICIIDEKHVLTYYQYFEKALLARGFLKRIGINTGDRIIIRATQTIPYLTMQLGIQLCGAIFVPIEKGLEKEKIKEIILDTNAKCLLIENDTPLQTDISQYNYNEIFNLSEKYNCDEYIFPKGNTISEILFTTGTTGKSKGVVMSHNGCIAVAENVKFGTSMEEDNLEIIPIPLNHSYALRRYYGNMINGSTVIIMMGVLNVKKFFSYMDEYNVSALALVPAAIEIITKLSGDKISEYKNQLKYIQIGSAALPDAKKKMLKKLLPGVALYNFYGCTEAGCSSLYNFNVENELENCIGIPTKNSKIKFVDEKNNYIVPTIDKPGLLVTSGEMLMECYWNDLEETKKALKNGEIYSNDLAYINNEGQILLIGRADDIININGNKVSPLEVEEVALKISEIKDCACISINDKENAKLYVVVKDDEDISLITIRTLLSKYLEKYKVPKYIEKIQEIPRTFNGKINREELRKKERGEKDEKQI